MLCLTAKPLFSKLNLFGSFSFDIYLEEVGGSIDTCLTSILFKTFLNFFTDFDIIESKLIAVVDVQRFCRCCFLIFFVFCTLLLRLLSLPPLLFAALLLLTMFLSMIGKTFFLPNSLSWNY
jgi:hypothetical protein